MLLKYGMLDLRTPPYNFPDKGKAKYEIVFDGSSTIEGKGTRGLSHFSEHLLFYNNDKIIEEFENDHLDINAYTSNDRVVFYISGLNRFVEKHIGEFTDNILSGLASSEERFEQEKKVILQEYKRAFNTPNAIHRLNRDRRQYNNYNPIGDYKDIENITYEGMKAFIDKWYRNPSRIINQSNYDTVYLSAPIDYNRTFYLTKYISGNYDTPLEPNLNSENIDTISIIGATYKPYRDDEFGKISFICSILGEGMKSPLFTELRQKRSLCYTYSFFPSNPMNVIKFVLNTTNDNYQTVINVFSDVLKEAEKYITEEKINELKRSMSIEKESVELKAIRNTDEFINGFKYEIYDYIKSVTREELLYILDKYFQPRNFMFTNGDDIQDVVFPDIVNDDELAELTTSSIMSNIKIPGSDLH